MHSNPKGMSEKTRGAIISCVLLLISLLFGSSASILSPTNGGLGTLFGGLLSITICLVPVLYVRIRNVKVKNPKPLLIEPSAWIMVPLSFAVSASLLFYFLVITLIPPLNHIWDEVDKDTFMGSSIFCFALITSLAAPACAYAFYVLTHYKRIIEYGTTEWKKAKADRKATKNQE